MTKFFAISATALLLAILSFTPSHADEVYQASMTGIDCAGCKKKIVKALGALPGVKYVRVEPRKKKGQHQLVVKTDGSDPITEEEAKKALSIAEHYQLTTWVKKK